MTGSARLFAAAAVLAILAPAAASAAEATILGTFDNWRAATLGSGAAKTCYVEGQPKTSLPKKAKRDAIFFVLSDWPARKAKSEAEVIPGYAFKPDSKVIVEVGSEKFSFFTKNEGSKGHAWVEAKADDSRLAQAMEAGSELTVSGESQRGTKTKDSYSLAGLTAALKKAHEACGM